MQLFVERRNKWTSASRRDLQYAFDLADFRPLPLSYVVDLPSYSSTRCIICPTRQWIETVGKRVVRIIIPILEARWTLHGNHRICVYVLCLRCGRKMDGSYPILIVTNFVVGYFTLPNSSLNQIAIILAYSSV